jgi:SAM-dependent methyltransferase
LINPNPSSFRDPSGFIFESDGEIYRQVNKIYQNDFDLLISSGLYDELVNNHLLVKHEEVNSPILKPEIAYKIIKIERIKFISYPYEWSFSQLKDAALLTLHILLLAINKGMILKDASAYNVQFHEGKPIFIDTLSFAKYEEGSPWQGYKQFCQHFLAPLALMSFKDTRLRFLLSNFIDGVPLDLASKLLPKKTRFNYGLLTHIHIHALAQTKIINSSSEKRDSRKVNILGLIGLIENLENTIKKLNCTIKEKDWVNYYQSTNYSEHSFEFKKDTVKKLIKKVSPKSILDLGANTGVFSRLGIGSDGCKIISIDNDAGAVEINYLETKSAFEKDILPLVVDIMNPSPGIGWNNNERMKFSDRGSFDLVLALALVHHLSISNNIPFSMVSEVLSKLGKFLIIEFIPKDDSQIQKLLNSRDDIFSDYSITNFKEIFSKDFFLIDEIQIDDSLRTLFLFERK